ncbi:MAG: hypothetical protein ACLT5P_10010 [Flavonifractor plautii]
MLAQKNSSPPTISVSWLDAPQTLPAAAAKLVLDGAVVERPERPLF